MTFGDKLKLIRTKHGMTQEAFAEKLHVSRSAIAKWEANNGMPEISSLKIISQVFQVSLDDLLNDERGIGESEVKETYTDSDYIGYLCDIELTGWNDGVYNAIILGEDEDLLFYQKTEKGHTIHGLLGKKHITSIKQYSKSNSVQYDTEVNRNYFCNKHVLIEVAHSKGFFKGFFDFQNDDYLDVIILAFHDSKVLLKFGRTIDMENITKIEEIGIFS